MLKRLRQTISSDDNEEQLQVGIPLDPELLGIVQEIAFKQDKTIEAMVRELLLIGVSEYRFADEVLRLWRRLSEREQEVLALICLGFKTAEIAQRMTISTNTVKTHIRNVLVKLNMRSRAELQTAFSIWEFDEWYQAKYSDLHPDSPISSSP